VLGDLRHDLVARRLLHQHDHGGPALGQLLAELLHEVVVDAVVARRAAGRTRRRSDGHSEHRHEEEQSDHAAPEGAACRADAGERGLVQLELAVLLVLDDHGVLERERVLLDELADRAHHVVCLVHVVVGDRHEICH
jgi:hypothetical protein